MNSMVWRKGSGATFEKPTYDVSLKQIETAAGVIRPYVVKTPMIESDVLSAMIDRPVFLKCENQQITGSFKVRGALARLSRIEGQARFRGVIAASAGNHGIGLAYACRQVGIPGLVVVPEGTPKVKIDALHEFYVKVRIHGTCFDDAEAHAVELARSEGATYVSAYDDPWIIAGNGGTLGLEIAEQIPDLSAVVTPVGGGGLAIGLAKSLPDVAVVGVNTQASPAMLQSLVEGKVYDKFDAQPTVAEGLAGGVSANTVALCANSLAGMGAVSEGSLTQAISLVMKKHKEIIEGSAAAPVAAILENLSIPGTGPVCLILTGRNIDREALRDIVLSR